VRTDGCNTSSIPVALPAVQTADGVELRVWRWRAVSARATVVLVPGFGAGGLHPSVASVARMLVEHGFEVLSYDARGHGESGGLSTLIDREHLDVAAVTPLATAPLVVVGVSMGAVAVLRWAAGASPGCDGLVVVSAPAKWRVRPAFLALGLLTRTSLGVALLGRLSGARVDRRFRLAPAPASLVCQIRQPLAVVHGVRDRLLPARDAPLLLRDAPAPRRLWLLADMGHGLVGSGTSAILEAVEWALAAAPAFSG
jgi:pimeloyl-ACP methyl ester carboxylesterase